MTDMDRKRFRGIRSNLIKENEKAMVKCDSILSSEFYHGAVDEIDKWINGTHVSKFTKEILREVDN